MKKAVKIAFMVIIIAALLLAACFFARLTYYRAYSGSRLTGTVTVTVDGEVYKLKKDQVSGGDTVKIKKGGSAYFSAAAGEYGRYMFFVRPEALDDTVEISVMKSKWWDIKRFELNISIDTKKGTVTYSGTSSSLTDLGQRKSSKIKGRQDTSEDRLVIMF